jgi:adenosine deaminase/adenosine deaminase CECR1
MAESTLGLVQPEDLPLIQMLLIAIGANRIGQWVDMAYEGKSYELLRYMENIK